MKKQTIVFSGGTSGLGEVAFRNLAESGNEMILLARNTDQAKAKFEDLQSGSKVEIVECDLSSFESIRNAISTIKEHSRKIDQLILNAGLWNFSFKESKDGIEEIFQVNLLANIMLIEGLKESINSKGRIIITSSALHRGKIHFEDIEFRSNFSGYKAYQQTKLGTILLTKRYAEELKSKEIKIVCQHPGVVNTRLGRDAGSLSRLIFKLIGKSSEKGARTLIYLMTIEFQQLSSGSYYANSKVKSTHTYSTNLNIADQLFEKCQAYIS